MKEIKNYLKINHVNYNEAVLCEYLEFIKMNSVEDKPYDNHHILMKSMFRDIENESWNIVKLRP